MNENETPRPVVLCILDGWGHREARDNNAIAQAATPFYDQAVSEAPMSLLDASAGAVGLPAGQMGNSEVGHMNIGGGRVVMQDLPRIDAEIASGAFARNPGLTDFIARAKAGSGRVHLMGLLSPGGVHSHQDQMAELARILDAAGLTVVLHAFLDGRDTPPKSALGFLGDFLAKAPAASPGVVSGRYYAMDRDKRWDRVEKAYDALVLGEGQAADSAQAAVEQGYAADASDEFVLPTIVGDYTGMADGDSLLMANFRADRAREILEALVLTEFEGFARRKTVRFATAAGLVEYSVVLNPHLITLFPPLDLNETLGEVVARAGRSQLRIAETEKYAHVTFFLNGGREEPFTGEERILVPSPKVATYDLQPEMSAPEVTDRLVAAVESGQFDLIVCNFANGDMVGHSGNLEAAMAAVECLDACLARLSAAVDAAGGALLVTADHGNAEQMLDPDSGEKHTAHTMNKVPFLLLGGPSVVRGLKDGCLADVAPTVLSLMQLEQPKAMTGRSLLEPPKLGAAAE